jgi:drug/metabolite transporter (DMT)-like permease
MSGDHDNKHEENAKCSPFGVTTFVLGLVSGTFSAVTCKIAYDTTSVGIDGHEKAFSKPILMLLLMFAAMTPALAFWKIQQSQIPEHERDKLEPGSLTILVIPSVCDLLCTLLLLVAQLYITASLWQMMRGSIIIITALLKRFALGHRLKTHMWIGVGVITIAMILVASTSFFGNADQSSAGSSKDPRVGILLVLVGCLAQGVQCKFMHLRPHDCFPL